MRNTITGRHSLIEYDSLADFLEHAQRHEDAPALRYAFREGEWAGNLQSTEHLWHLCRVGWAEGQETVMETAQRAVDTVEREYDVPRWQSYYDVAGSDVDVARYLAGEPENMIGYTMVETPRTGRVVSLAMNASASGGVSANALVRRGKAVTSLVFALERIGIRTELYVDNPGKGSDGYTSNEVLKVKDASDVLDPAMVMLVFAHPGFYRAAVLGAMHSHPIAWHAPMNIGGTYGTPAPSNPDEFPPGTHVLNTALDYSVVGGGGREDDITNFVVKHLKNLGLI